MHQRQPQHVGNVLLVDGKRHRAVLHQPQALQPPKQMHQQHGHAFSSGAPARRQQVVIDHAFFTRGQPGDVVTQAGIAAKQLPQPFARKHAQADVGDGFNAMHGTVAELLLQADQVARQQKIEDLATPVAQRLVAKSPAGIQREYLAVGVLFVNQGVACGQHPGAAAKRLNERQFIGRNGREGTGLTQAARAASGRTRDGFRQ